MSVGSNEPTVETSNRHHYPEAELNVIQAHHRTPICPINNSFTHIHICHMVAVADADRIVSQLTISAINLNLFLQIREMDLFNLLQHRVKGGVISPTLGNMRENVIPRAPFIHVPIVDLIQFSNHQCHRITTVLWMMVYSLFSCMKTSSHESTNMKWMWCYTAKQGWSLVSGIQEDHPMKMLIRYVFDCIPFVFNHELRATLGCYSDIGTWTIHWSSCSFNTHNRAI